mgnify:CR=1 FL=1
MMVEPELVERFRGDLAPLWPFVGEEGARLGLAVSGGGDSLALLLLAHALLPGRIEAATVDHALRRESAEEAAMVAAVCERLGVPHAVLRVEVAKGNLQDRARFARYYALGRWCDERDLKGLATAHQLDDQAETFVMRLNRGSGVAGLAAIRALGMVPGAGVRLVRPLLGWRRAELANLVRTSQLVPVHDPSNENPSFDRVRIRQALASADWLDPVGIARSAQLLAQADLAIEWMIDREYAECVSIGEGEATYHALRTGLGGPLIHAGVIQSIYRGFGSSIGRSDAAAMVHDLSQGRKTNVAGLQATPRDVDGERIWAFTPEQSRSTS